MEEKVETKQLEKELEAKVGDLVGRVSESLKVKVIFFEKIFWKLVKW